MFSLAVEGMYMEKEMKNENSRLPNWLQARLNKDNLWNLVFAFAMSSGFFLAMELGKEYSKQAFFLSWTTILGVPLLVKYFTKISFADGKFLNKERKELNLPDQLPNGFFIIVSTILSIIITGAIIDSFNGASVEEFAPRFSRFLLLSEFFFIPVLFFIFKNCPISILFNLQFYKQNMRFVKSSSTDWIHDPQQCNVAGNIYYNNHNSYYLNNHHR